MQSICFTTMGQKNTDKKSKNKQMRYLSPNVLMVLDQSMRKMKRSETDKCQRPEAFPNFVNCLMMINQSQGHFAG